MRKPQKEVGGYDPLLIAGEEPEMCVRLRKAGWAIWWLDAEMTLHDADIQRFGQWWKRNKRSCHAYAEGASMHGAKPEEHIVAQTRRALIWGAFIPVCALLGLLTTPWALLLLLAIPLQMLRLKVAGMCWSDAIFLTLGKLPEAQGALGFYWGRLRGTKSAIIAYKWVAYALRLSAL